MLRRTFLSLALTLLLLLILALPVQAAPGGGDGIDPCHPPFTGMMLC